MSIGGRLRSARAALEKTQEEVSAAAGIPLATYKKYEGDDRRPGAEAIEGFIRAGINANWLLTGDGPVLLEELQHQAHELEEARARLDQAQAERDALQARVAEIEARLQATRPEGLILNDAAMRGMIQGVVEATRGRDVSAEYIARQAVEFYRRAIEEGLITATGVGEGGAKAS
jgi:transcriptional regulator with XRE-family HTH domain